LETLLEFLSDYGLFLAKSVTVLVVIGLIVAMLAAAKKNPDQNKGEIRVTKLNDQLDEYQQDLRYAVLDDDSLKAELKQEKKQQKQAAKDKKQQSKKDKGASAEEGERKRRIFVLDFDGDIRASAASNLRHEITAVLSIAEEHDEIVVKLESGGGMVHSYGLAASQLDRISSAKIPLTVCIDKVAASGGYMMACVADKILAAPFAIVGSIGVVAQLPNFHKLLKKNDIDVEVLTAGEHKRTLTMFGENTDKGRQKFVDELQETHDLFKDYVAQRRSSIDVAEVATGEVWYGSRAVENGLVDEVKTSDEYLVTLAKDADVYTVNYETKKKLGEKLGLSIEHRVDSILSRWWGRAFSNRSFH